MTVEEVNDYISGMVKTCKKDKDPRSTKCKEVLERVLELIDERRALQNRCYVHGMGTLCIFCNMECPHKGYIATATEVFDENERPTKLS